MNSISKWSLLTGLFVLACTSDKAPTTSQSNEQNPGSQQSTLAAETLKVAQPDSQVRPAGWKKPVPTPEEREASRQRLERDIEEARKRFCAEYEAKGEPCPRAQVQTFDGP